MTLDVSTWEEFVFSDLISEIYKGKPHTKDELNPAPPTTAASHSLRYITRTAEDNGCEMLVVRNPHLEDAIEARNAISIGDTTATCFYQGEDFITGDHMVVVRADWLNPYTGTFITTLLNTEAYRYSYGRAFIMSSIRNTRVRLPIQRNANGDPALDGTKQFHSEGYVPDWQFMEDYIRSLNHKPLTTANSADSALSLDVSAWKFFFLKDLAAIDMGNKMDFSAIPVDHPCINFVGRSSANNGVMGKVDEQSSVAPYPAGSLTVALGGSLGSTYVQVEPFYTSQNVAVLQFDKDLVSLQARLFLANMIQFESRFKYFPFGRELNKYIRTTYGFDLPIQRDANGDPVIDDTRQFHLEGYVPDWQFMEDYMRSLPYGDRIPEFGEC